MKASELIPPLKMDYGDDDDDGMQFLPSILHTNSVVYDADFEDPEFDLLMLQDSNDVFL